MTQEMITIAKSEYISLQKAYIELEALEVSGVNNWCGYGEHYEVMSDEDIEFLENN